MAAAEPQEAVVVLCTVPDADTARRMARAVVEPGLAACVNVVPGLTSVYRWEGRLREDAEVLLLIKTRAGRLAELTAALTAAHPYSVPEVLALPVAEGHGPYLEWLARATLG